jgi:hypothetical protein
MFIIYDNNDMFFIYFVGGSVSLTPVFVFSFGFMICLYSLKKSKEFSLMQAPE